MPNHGDAFKWIEENTEMFRALGCKSILYVGCRNDTHPWWLKTFSEKILQVERVTIIDAYAPNVDTSRWMVPTWTPEVPVEYQHLNVRDITESYDAIFWDEGPEHVPLEELPEYTQIIKDHANKLVIYSCPWGECPQGEEGGNRFERHHYSPDPEHFKAMGMTVFCFGQRTVHGNIISYWLRNQ